MQALNIEIINPKAIKLIEAMLALELIKVKPAGISNRSSQEKADVENEESLWRDFSAQAFLSGYAADEPEYTEADIKEPNPEYKVWKEK